MPRYINGRLTGYLTIPASVIVPVDPYEGEYIVTPRTVEQSLETRGKQMLDDVTVLEIPYAETSNAYGTTVIIAS